MTSSQYDIRLIKDSDRDEIIDFLVNEFLQNEPMNYGLGMKKESKKSKLDRLLGAQFAKENSLIAFSKEDGRIVGLRLITLVNRESEKYMADINNNDNLDMNSPQRFINNILADVKKDLFNLLPSTVKTLVRTEISCVAKQWYRKGIAKRLENEGNDVIRKKFPEIQGIVAEATSIANQMLLKKEGYTTLKKSNFADFNIPLGYDGSDHVELMVKLF
uniref:N-acetyltransferase domain-containing protein n=1 Tax=Parastrongyloides trichosuri TaxID=131310 RepID=A0A0N4ZXK1_PARTI